MSFQGVRLFRFIYQEKVEEIPHLQLWFLPRYKKNNSSKKTSLLSKKQLCSLISKEIWIENIHNKVANMSMECEKCQKYVLGLIHKKIKTDKISGDYHVNQCWLLHHPQLCQWNTGIYICSLTIHVCKAQIG